MSIHTITTDVHNPVVPAHPAFTSDTTTDHMNAVQLMSECWSLGVDYNEYKATAEACGKYVHNETTYTRHCEGMDQEAAEYMKT